MKLIASAFCVAALCGAGVIAQESQVQTTRKIEVKHGRHVDVMGCVARTGDGLVLQNVDGQAGRNYLLVGKSDDLEQHVGQWVEVTGKAATADQGTVKVEDKTKVNGHEEKSQVQGTSGALGIAALGVDRLKKVRDNCSE